MTTTDIARLDTNAALALNGASDAMARLAQWVEAARNAGQLVAPLVDTAFVPDAYKPKIDPRATDEEKQRARNVAVANATAAVLQGLTLGVDPLVALQQIYIVHGRPGMYAKFMVALVQSHGHEVWDEDVSDTRAVVCGRRKGTEHIARVTITMDMARKAKWTSNAKYQETPQDMLWSRAASRVCDRIASDVLKGIASVEEIQDTIQVDATAGPATRTVRPRKQAALPAAPPQQQEEPPLDDEPAAAQPEPEQPDRPASQTRKMYALLRKTGREDKDTALVYISGVVGRPVESTKDLSRAEVGQVIDALDAPAEPEEPPLVDWPATAEPASGATDG